MSMKHKERVFRWEERKSTIWISFLLFIVPLTLGLYANTLSAGWYLDDFRMIVDNPSVRDLPAAFSNILRPRGVAHFSFALNYAFAGYSLKWFHVANIAIHLGGVLLVMLLLRECYPGRVLWPLWGGVLFAVHPLQTQAVNYVVQRMTLLATLFFLGAVLAYVKGRQRHLASDAAPHRTAWGYYAVSFLCAVGAFLSKENTVVLPAVILLVDYCLFGRVSDVRANVKWVVLPLLPLIACLAYSHFSAGNLSIGFPDARAEHFVLPEGAAASFAVAHPENLSLRYLLTEFTVFWLYVKLFLLPVGQVFDHCYPLVNNLFGWKSLLSLVSLMAALFATVRLRQRNRLLFLGAVWVPMALLVESSVIPLDTMVEHRTYLPMFGLILISIELVFRKLPRRLLGLSLLVVVVFLSFLTLSRNALWGRPLDFWADNVSKVPHSYRPVVGLGDAYMEAGFFEEAASSYLKALSMNPYNREEIYINLATAYIKSNRPELALRELKQAIALDTGNPKMATAFSHLGALLVSKGQFDEGIGYIEKAVSLNPRNVSALMNLGVAYDKAKRFDLAEDAYRKAILRDSENPDAHLALGFLLMQTGRFGEAVFELGIARGLAPENARALYYHGLALFRVGDMTGARRSLSELQTLDARYFGKLSKVLAGR